MFLSKRCMRLAVLIFVHLFVIGTSGLPVNSSEPLSSIETADQSDCDWAIWDSTAEAKGVHKLSISCSEGQVTWRNPYGGLRIEFSPPASTAQRSTRENNKYEVCLEATSFYASLQLSTEGDNRLTPIAVLNSARPKFDRPLCFQSTRGIAIAIYVEVDSSATSLAVGKLTLDYDIRVSDDLSSALDPDQKGCRPCTEEELVLAACITDYAFVGRLLSVTDDVDPEKTVIGVGVTHVLHQRLNVVIPASQSHTTLLLEPQGSFSLKLDDAGTLQKSTYDEVADYSRSYSVMNNPREIPVRFSHEFRQSDRPDFGRVNGQAKEEFVASVYTPRTCHAKSGDGLFLFLGRVRLKKALLQCAPRLSDFVRIWDKAVEQGSNPCSLD